uniref:Uncharacterized protein n=1 Tax=Chromera velia CCMP2878 TaxID=1169474 RepID=A0A0G4HKV2_9ALVE|eukprot:Cvel_28609.t1-p1 / transcript=Cvel_28609.t1 / gene=Cvel_28609 / organism=Chromera_velia_CCMP2878 / gene_product=hypothetical protein / transcript_product=hypothetical protein / location=Cvel_scaffold3774:9167-9931(-) / protein_length=255 / sequence_SO=supercontig / SO=protein_coding / is_pseudo=false
MYYFILTIGTRVDEYFTPARWHKVRVTTLPSGTSLYEVIEAMARSLPDVITAASANLESLIRLARLIEQETLEIVVALRVRFGDLVTLSALEGFKFQVIETIKEAMSAQRTCEALVNALKPVVKSLMDEGIDILKRFITNVADEAYADRRSKFQKLEQRVEKGIDETKKGSSLKNLTEVFAAHSERIDSLGDRVSREVQAIKQLVKAGDEAMSHQMRISSLAQTGALGPHPAPPSHLTSALQQVSAGAYTGRLSQ